MFGDMLTDKEKIDLLIKIVNNLLPNWKDGEIAYYGEERKKAKFIKFSYNNKGEILCVLQPPQRTFEGIDGRHDFFSAVVVPLNEVYMTRELL